MKKHWYDYLWIWTILYFALGFFNILFAWLGMIDFLVPLIIAILGGNKSFCNRYCGRGQLFGVCGGCSRHARAPKWISSKWFRYGFLVFFLSMFGSMIFLTYLVAAGAANLREAIKLLIKQYDRSKSADYVHNPVAHAFYHTWKQVEPPSTHP